MSGSKNVFGQSEIRPNFRSNSDVAVHVLDLAKAEKFYGDVMGFKLVSRNNGQLAFDTGTFTLWLNEGEARSYIPSFSVRDSVAARKYLENNGCTPVGPHAPTYFKDPFGFVFDIIAQG